MIKVAAVAAMLLMGAAEPAWNWADATDEITNNPEYAPSKALCRAVRGREPPAADRPDATAAAALKGCDSEALYYGIGASRDPARARMCAFLEAGNVGDGDRHAPFRGRAMLMTIYANGEGAARDLDAATNFACQVEGAPAEMHGRVTHLAELKRKNWSGNDFHFCDDVTSGLAAGYCADHGARITGAKRDAGLAALIAGWSQREKLALVPLRAAQQAYAEAHSDGEIDATGTMRGVFWAMATEARANEFADLLRSLVEGKTLEAGGGYAAADRTLNLAYRARLAALKAPEGTVTANGVRAAQRAWLRYRDAFLAFAAVKFPGVPRESLAAWLTAHRTKVLLSEENPQF